MSVCMCARGRAHFCLVAYLRVSVLMHLLCYNNNNNNNNNNALFQAHIRPIGKHVYTIVH